MAEKDPHLTERHANGRPRERDGAVPHANGAASPSARNRAQRTHAHDEPAARMAEDAPPLNPYKGNRGLTRAWYALKNSIQGFRDAWREESAFRQELTLSAILVPVSIFLPVDPVEHVLLVGSVLLVLIVELLNSSVEAAIDRISLDLHELSKRAKDFGSAAVTVALLLCLLTWILLAGPVIIHWFR
ncbi:Diacylglycerol kinase (modular protein) [Pararobbsia alpina]|uniref:diacylglycerol kinase n=1 Tax=Pararobbsia alpina TaxID=621374 RepID=UPI0039A58560